MKIELVVVEGNPLHLCEEGKDLLRVEVSHLIAQSIRQSEDIPDGCGYTNGLIDSSDETPLKLGVKITKQEAN